MNYLLSLLHKYMFDLFAMHLVAIILIPTMTWHDMVAPSQIPQLPVASGMGNLTW